MIVTVPILVAHTIVTTEVMINAVIIETEAMTTVTGVMTTATEMTGTTMDTIVTGPHIPISPLLSLNIYQWK